jgi:hypothetical protein
MADVAGPHVGVGEEIDRLRNGDPVVDGGMVVMAGVHKILEWMSGEPFSGWILEYGLWVTLGFVLLINYWSGGVTLTQSAAVVHKWRRRAISWSDVPSIQIKSVLGGRTVVICEASGRRTKLEAPRTGFLFRDRRFEEKFCTIETWWLDHRGPDRAPPPPGARGDGPSAADGDPFAPSA